MKTRKIKKYGLKVFVSEEEFRKQNRWLTEWDLVLLEI